MLRFMLLACLLCWLGLCHGMRETCSDSTVVYRNGFTFTSVKSDGRSYNCYCIGSGCVRISCSRSSLPTAPPPTHGTITTDDDGDEGITGVVVPGGDGSETTGINPIFIGTSDGGSSSGGTCYDTKSGREFSRGENFIRITSERIRQSCTCPLSGDATITCETAGCKLPDPPQRPRRQYNFATGCYDAWNDREYRSGTVYNRTRQMDLDNRIMGVYRCTCSNNLMRCSAVDIPCCNMETGEFTQRGERFITIHVGIKMECTCDGQRGRYSRCLRLDGTNPFGPGGTLITGTRYPNYRPIGGSRGGGCTDRYSGRFYRPYERWTQDRGLSGVWSCRCIRTTRTFQTSCRFMRS